MIESLNAALEGRYRIERKLGEGGMATVFLARDLKHNRQVALKVLKPELAAVVGADRFLTEIETTANLQHPHILPLYDSGEADSFLYYVMPYVEGPTLRERLDDDKQLPVDEAVRIARALAAALEFAHSHDVVHRDIKPANILFQADQPVLGDFGIALAVGAGGGARLTETGLSVGTPYYMSPEQATGDQSVGARSDIYSLGCVLYEMLVGDPPFTGSTAQAVLGQIISGGAVTASERRTTIPAHVDAVIRKALERVPADRFASAAEMSGALADPSFRHGVGAADGADERSARPWKLATAAAAVAALAGVGWGLTAQGAPETRESRSIRLALPAELGTWTGLAVSPDGSFMVHALLGDPPDEGQDGTTRTRALWLQRWDGLPPTEIPGTRGARVAAVSPDGERVAFTTEDGALRTVPVDGGQGVTLHPDVGFTSLAWGDDGHIYGSFATTRSPTVQRVPETGGPAEDVTTAIAGRSHRDPQLLPNGRGLLYRSFPNSLTEAADSVGVLDFETGEQRILTDGRNGWYSPSGHLVWVRESQLVAQPMDFETLRLIGSPVPIADRVIGFLAAEESRDVLFLEGVAGGAAPELVWLGADESETVVASFPPGTPFPQDPTPSPDGSRAALVLEEDGVEVLHVIDADTDLRTRLAEGGRPSWSSDGRYVGFALVDSIDSLWRVRADGSAPPERLTADHLNADFQLGRWSLDGPIIVGTTTGLAMVEPGDSVAMPIFEADERYWDPALSPDGRWVAYYTVGEDGEPRAFVRPYPELGSALYPVSVGFGQDVQWSADGTTLYYDGQTEEGQDIFAAELETEPEFRIVSREPRFPLQRGYNWSAGGWYYTVAPDGERALIVRRRSQSLEMTGFVLIQSVDRLLRAQVGG